MQNNNTVIITDPDGFKDFFVPLMKECLQDTLTSIESTKPQVKDEEQYLDSKTVAKMLNVTTQTVYNYRRKICGLKFKKICGKCVYLLSDVRKLVAGDSGNK